jgi:hypothetical protein
MAQLQKVKPGPITPEGKKRSSMNARTHGLYSRTLLPSESPHEFKSLVQSLQEEWGLTGPTAELLINNLAMFYFRLSRLESARTVVSCATFVSQQDRVDFCNKLGIDTALAGRISSWFMAEDPEYVTRCELAGKIRSQAKHLVDNFTSRNVAMATTELPQLWVEVMGSPAPNFNTSITQRMCQIHGCESQEEAAELHFKHVLEKYKLELLWLYKRSQIRELVMKMHASQMLFAMTRQDWQKAEQSILRQIDMALRQLLVLKDLQKRSALLIES